mgnify:CR=1 FL=1
MNMARALLCSLVVAAGALQLKEVAPLKGAMLARSWLGDAAEGDRISFYEEVPRKPHLYEELTEAELMATRGRLLDYFASVDRATAVAPRASFNENPWELMRNNNM